MGLSDSETAFCELPQRSRKGYFCWSSPVFYFNKYTILRTSLQVNTEVGKKIYLFFFPPCLKEGIDVELRFLLSFPYLYSLQ